MTLPKFIITVEMLVPAALVMLPMMEPMAFYGAVLQ